MKNITDQYVLDTFWSGKIMNLNKKAFNDDVKKYLLNRFEDSLSFKETLYRIKYHIDIRPKCECCGKDVKFIGKTKYIFRSYCSKECKHNSGLVGKHIKETKLIKYGDENYVNSNKAKETCLKKYGVVSILQLKENQDKARIASKTKESKDKIKMTCLRKYGVINPFNQPIVKDHAQIASKSKNTIDKIKLTWKNKTPEELARINNVI